MWRDDIGRPLRGGFAFRDSEMAQHLEAPEALARLCDELRPTTIIEIGTLFGGLTMLLSELRPEGCRLLSFDIRDQRSPDTKTCGAEFYCLDAYGDEGQAIVRDAIRAPGRCLVLCDGGSKVREVTLFGGDLKPGDVIMAHDYAPTRRYFQQHMDGTRWDCCEITDAAIREVLDDVGLLPYRAEWLTPVAWGCWIRPAV